MGFMLSGIVCLANNQVHPLDDLPLFLVVAGEATAACILIFHFFQYLDMLNSIGIGFYLAIISSHSIVYFSLGYKEKITQIELSENNNDSQITNNPSDD